MNEHSPGPWHWLYFKKGEGLMAHPFALSNGNQDVLLSTDNPWNGIWILSRPEDRALIAAAPDLLAACEGLRIALNWHMRELQEHKCDGSCAVCGSIRIADAAICKAKGEASGG